MRLIHQAERVATSARSTAAVATAAFAISLAIALAPTAVFGQARPQPASATRAGSSTAVRDLTADQQIMQALNRLTFGARPGEALAMRARGVDAWIAQQLRPEKINDSKTEAMIAANYPALQQDQNALAQSYADFVRARVMRKRARADTTAAVSADDVQAFRKVAQERTQLVAQLSSSRVARAVTTERQLQEVMTDFWENHFNVYARKGPAEPYYLADFDRNVIRPNALGKFRDLLGAVAKSPAMLFYLDNAKSRANPGQPTLAPERMRNAMNRRGAQNARQPAGLNENYGRELLELHTLGVDGGYTQQDVVNVARAFTGWTINPPAQGGGFVFRAAWHDAGEKMVLGQKLPAGRGIEDGEQVLDMVSRSPATAKFIATELARRFVSDSPSAALVSAAAARFLATGGDIRETVRTIVTSPEFFSRSAFRSKVKSPFEVVVSTARALGAQPDPTPTSARAVAFLGQPIFGHQAPNGYPETGESWMNTGAILNRINFGMAVAGNSLPGASIAALPGADSLRNAPRAQQVDAVVASILGGAASPDTRAVLLSGDNPLAASMGTTAAAAQADTAGSADDGSGMEASTQEMTMTLNMMAPAGARRVKGGNGKRAMGGNPFAATPQLQGFAQVVGLALGSPEFQRR